MIYSWFNSIYSNQRFRMCAFAAVFMMMVAHAYSYFNGTFVADRFLWFNGYKVGGNSFAATGKWFGKYQAILNWNSYLPWLDGVITISYMIVILYIICSVLEIKNFLNIIIIAGLIATDASVIQSHFYTPEGFIIALLFACISVWSWNKTDWKRTIRILVGAIFISLSLATYGSYTTVGPTLVILVCMVDLLKNQPVVSVLKRGFEYIITFLVGMGVYYVILRLVLRIQNLEMLSYMNEDRLVKGATISEILHFIELAYKNSIKYYLGSAYSYQPIPQWMSIGVLVASAVAIVVLLRIERIKSKSSIILLVVLAIVFPLSAGAIYILAFGMVHNLMTFTFVLFYIGLVKLGEMLLFDQGSDMMRFQKTVSGVLSAVFLISLSFMVYKGILVSNMCYSRIYNLYQVSNGVSLRILERIEGIEEFEGDEEIVFVGDVTESDYFTHSRYEDSDALNLIDGLIAVDKERANVFLYPSHLIMFMQENAEIDLKMDYYDKNDNQYTAWENSIISEMPIYPADGSVRKIGDTVVVKFTDIIDD